MRVPDHIHEELCNWSRWCWLGEWPHPLPATQCGSLESQYRAPPEWDMDLAEAPQNYIRPNERHAKVVQAVYDQLWEPRRCVLQAEYPARFKYKGRQYAAGAMGLSVRGYEELLMEAVQEVEAAFEVRV